MADQAKRSKVEGIKGASDYLVDGIPDELAEERPNFDKDTSQVLKFHGIYQQDDRDVRRERAKQGLGKDYICMVRASIPGGALSAEQYTALDDLAGSVADGTLRITSRQGIQYHFTRKGDLAGLIAALNSSLVTTLGACGDVVRNVMCCPAATADREHADVQALAKQLSRHLKPQSRAYWQLWLDGERAVEAVEPDDDAEAGDADEAEVEPLYGATYLPRKFKVGMAFPGDNCIDAYTQDIGVVPHVADDGSVEAATLIVGGGLGMTHKKPATYPKLGDPVATVAPDELVEVVKAIVGIQRDHGDRGDRTHARMKYLVDDWGLAAFRAEVELRLGRALPAPRALEWGSTDDHLGWRPQGEQDSQPTWTLGVRVPNGRIADGGEAQLRTGLRRAVERFGLGVRFTPRQDVVLTGIAGADAEAVETELRGQGVALAGEYTPLARHAMACPAMPTCGLAIAEAERSMPDLVEALDAKLAAYGLEEQAIHVRLTGCPNGCARPYSTEVGVVGSGKDAYVLFLGGNAEGTRLGSVYAERVGLGEVPEVLEPVLGAYAAERRGSEAFGDFCHRVGVEGLQQRFASQAA
jgi:sulfite reductase (ferredoxin)